MTDVEKQQILDEEHLKLLRIGYIVAGVADAFFSLFPLIYVVFGLVIAVSATRSARPGEPSPAVFGLLFVVIGLIISLVFAAQAGLKLYTARALGRREHRMACFIAAALSCLQMPWGILLGVFTFMVLGRGSVRDLFERTPAQLSDAPQRMHVTLFDDDEAFRS